MDAGLDGAGDAGVVVGVDDAHLLDDQSAFPCTSWSCRTRRASCSRSGQGSGARVDHVAVDGRSADSTGVAAIVDGGSGGAAQRGAGRPRAGRGCSPDVVARRMWSLTGGNVLYLHHILDEEIKADRGGGWPAARGNAAGDAVSPVAMPRAGSSSAMNRYPNAGSSWWIIRSRRIDSVSRYLWAKLSWVPDSSTFDGICGLVGRRGPRQRGPREGDLADRCQHTGGVGAALRFDVGVEHSVDLLALTEHW